MRRLRAALRVIVPWLAVLLLALLAIAVRAPSLTSARPYINYVDEGNYLHVPARMIRDGSWIPDQFLYPSLPINLVAATARAADPLYRLAHGGRSIRDDLLTKADTYYDLLEPFELLLLGRVLSFLAGLGVVLVTGLLARRVAGPRAGLFAAFVAALLPALVARGGFAMVDPYATLFVAACLLFTERTRTAEPGRDGREAVLAGAMAGFAFASKYPSILVSLSFALAVWLSRPSWRERLRLWTLGSLGAIGAALLAMPGLVFAPESVLAGLRRQSELYGLLTSPPLWPQVFKQAEWDLPFQGPELGWTFVLLFIAGLAVALWDRRTRIPALGWTLFLVLNLALYLRQSFQPFRNLLPLVPVLCVAVAVLFARIRERVPRPAWTDAAAFLLIGLLFGIPAVRFARERATFEDSRTQAVDWLERHGLPGQTVLVLENLAFQPSQLARLKGMNVEVYGWNDMRRPLLRRRVRYVVLTQMATMEDKPLIEPEWLRILDRRYKRRVQFGEQPVTAHPGHWHGNRQTMHILERRRLGNPGATRGDRPVP